MSNNRNSLPEDCLESFLTPYFLESDNEFHFNTECEADERRDSFSVLNSPADSCASHASKQLQKTMSDPSFRLKPIGEISQSSHIEPIGRKRSYGRREQHSWAEYDHSSEERPVDVEGVHYRPLAARRVKSDDEQRKSVTFNKSVTYEIFNYKNGNSPQRVERGLTNLKRSFNKGMNRVYTVHKRDKKTQGDYYVHRRNRVDSDRVSITSSDSAMSELSAKLSRVKQSLEQKYTSVNSEPTLTDFYFDRSEFCGTAGSYHSGDTSSLNSYTSGDSSLSSRNKNIRSRMDADYFKRPEKISRRYAGNQCRSVSDLGMFPVIEPQITISRSFDNIFKEIDASPEDHLMNNACSINEEASRAKSMIEIPRKVDDGQTLELVANKIQRRSSEGSTYRKTGRSRRKLDSNVRSKIMRYETIENTKFGVIHITPKRDNNGPFTYRNFPGVGCKSSDASYDLSLNNRLQDVQSLSKNEKGVVKELVDQISKFSGPHQMENEPIIPCKPEVDQVKNSNVAMARQVERESRIQVKRANSKLRSNEQVNYFPIGSRAPRSSDSYDVASIHSFDSGHQKPDYDNDSNITRTKADSHVSRDKKQSNQPEDMTQSDCADEDRRGIRQIIADKISLYNSGDEIYAKCKSSVQNFADSQLEKIRRNFKETGDSDSGDNLSPPKPPRLFHLGANKNDYIDGRESPLVRGEDYRRYSLVDNDFDYIESAGVVTGSSTDDGKSFNCCKAEKGFFEPIQETCSSETLVSRSPDQEEMESDDDSIFDDESNLRAEVAKPMKFITSDSQEDFDCIEFASMNRSSFLSSGASHDFASFPVQEKEIPQCIFPKIIIKDYSSIPVDDISGFENEESYQSFKIFLGESDSDSYIAQGYDNDLRPTVIEEDFPPSISSLLSSLELGDKINLSLKDKSCQTSDEELESAKKAETCQNECGTFLTADKICQTENKEDLLTEDKTCQTEDEEDFLTEDKTCQTKYKTDFRGQPNNYHQNECKVDLLTGDDHSFAVDDTRQTDDTKSLFPDQNPHLRSNISQLFSGENDDETVVDFLQSVSNYCLADTENSSSESEVCHTEDEEFLANEQLCRNVAETISFDKAKHEISPESEFHPNILVFSSDAETNVCSEEKSKLDKSNNRNNEVIEFFETEKELIFSENEMMYQTEDEDVFVVEEKHDSLAKGANSTKLLESRNNGDDSNSPSDSDPKIRLRSQSVDILNIRKHWSGETFTSPIMSDVIEETSEKCFSGAVDHGDFIKMQMRKRSCSVDAYDPRNKPEYGRCRQRSPSLATNFALLNADARKKAASQMINSDQKILNTFFERLMMHNDSSFSSKFKEKQQIVEQSKFIQDMSSGNPPHVPKKTMGTDKEISSPVKEYTKTESFSRLKSIDEDPDKISPIKIASLLDEIESKLKESYPGWSKPPHSANIATETIEEQTEKSLTSAIGTLNSNVKDEKRNFGPKPGDIIEMKPKIIHESLLNRNLRESLNREIIERQREIQESIRRKSMVDKLDSLSNEPSMNCGESVVVPNPFSSCELISFENKNLKFTEDSDPQTSVEKAHLQASVEESCIQTPTTVRRQLTRVEFSCVRNCFEETSISKSPKETSFQESNDKSCRETALLEVIPPSSVEEFNDEEENSLENLDKEQSLKKNTVKEISAGEHLKLQSKSSTIKESSVETIRTRGRKDILSSSSSVYQVSVAESTILNLKGNDCNTKEEKCDRQLKNDSDIVKSVIDNTDRLNIEQRKKMYLKAIEADKQTGIKKAPLPIPRKRTIMLTASDNSPVINVRKSTQSVDIKTTSFKTLSGEADISLSVHETKGATESREIDNVCELHKKDIEAKHISNSPIYVQTDIRNCIIPNVSRKGKGSSSRQTEGRCLSRNRIREDIRPGSERVGSSNPDFLSVPANDSTGDSDKTVATVIYKPPHSPSVREKHFVKKMVHSSSKDLLSSEEENEKHFSRQPQRRSLPKNLRSKVNGSRRSSDPLVGTNGKLSRDRSKKFQSRSLELLQESGYSGDSEDEQVSLSNNK